MNKIIKIKNISLMISLIVKLKSKEIIIANTKVNSK